MSRKNAAQAEIDTGINELAGRGFEPKVIVLSLAKYQELMQSLAAQSGRDHLEAHLYYRQCLLVSVTAPDFLEVAPDAREMWERGGEFPSTQEDAPRTDSYRRPDLADKRIEPRFTEL